MDYLEEQKSEIEALESIYYGDFALISESPSYKFSIPIKTEETDQNDEEEECARPSCNLIITYTKKYPEEVPIIEIEDNDNFNEAELLEYLQEQAKENLGMVMVFNLVSAAQEWLNVKYDKTKKDQEEAVAKKLQEEEETERKRFEGTRVTIETFLKWKAQFEEEMGISARKVIAEKEGKKLNGRELFMTDTTLNESDLKYLDEADRVVVDESLFQDMEDLDIDDEEDDEDYDPNKDSDFSD